MKIGVDYIGVGAGALVFNDEGKVLIAKRGPDARNESGKWEFPGGGVEYGETCEEAIVREIKEEFDIEIELVGLLEVVNHILPEEHQHWVSPSFIARHVSGTAKILEPHKISDFKWIDINEINEGILSQASRHNLIAYRKKKST